MNINASHRSAPTGTPTFADKARAPVNHSEDFNSGSDWFMDNNYSPRNPPRSIEEIRSTQPSSSSSWTDWIKWVFNVQ